MKIEEEVYKIEEKLPGAVARIEVRTTLSDAYLVTTVLFLTLSLSSGRPFVHMTDVANLPAPIGIDIQRTGCRTTGIRIVHSSDRSRVRGIIARLCAGRPNTTVNTDHQSHPGAEFVKTRVAVSAWRFVAVLEAGDGGGPPVQESV